MVSAEFRKYLDMRASLAQPNPGDPLPPIEERRRGFENSLPDAPADVKVTAVKAGGVPAEWVCAPGSDPDRRLLYLHGGGYTVGSPRSHRRMVSDISRAAGCAILSLDYRLAPENQYPAQLEDALAAYGWIAANGPSGPADARSLWVAGDSAGGGLALSLLVALRDRGLGQPAGAIAFSAWTDCASEGDSMRTRAGRDPIINADAARGAAPGFLGNADPRTPTASPLYADYTGICPLFLNVGDDEVLLDDTLRVASKASASGVEVVLQVEPRGFHVYPLFVPDAPESKYAIAAVGSFVKDVEARGNA